MFKKILKWFGLLLILVTLCIGGLYFSAPYWLPSQVQKLLPENIKLLTLNSSNIGFSSTQLDDLQLKIEGDTAAQLNLRGIKLHYSLWEKSLSSISIEAAQVTVSNKPPSSSLSSNLPTKINIPQLPFDTISIDSLSLRGLALQRFEFTGLNLSQTDNKLVAEGIVNAFNIESEFSAVIQSQQQLLTKISTYVKSQSEALPFESQLDFIPQKDNISWNILGDVNLEDASLLPIEGLSRTHIKLDALLNKQQGYQLTFKPTSQISAQLDLAETELPSQLSTAMLEAGISAELSPLAKSSQVHLRFLNDSSFSYTHNKDRPRLKLTAGELALELQNPLAELRLKIQQLDLDLQKALGDPTQFIQAELASLLHIKDVQYKNQRLALGSKTLNADLIHSLSLDAGKLSIKHKSGKLQISETRVDTENAIFELAPSYWNSQANLEFSLLPTFDIDKQNLQIALAKPSQVLATLKAENRKTQTINSTLNKASATITKETISSDYQLKNIGLPQQSISIGSITGDSVYHIQSSLITGSANVTEVNFANDDFAFDNISTQLDWVKKDDDINLSGFLTQNSIGKNKAKIPFDYQINLASDKHKLSLKPLKLSIDTLSEWLEPTLQKFPNLSISGSDLVSQSIQGNPLELAFDGQLLFESLNLNYDELKVKSWKMQEQLSPEDTLLGQSNNSIKSIEIASGINLSHIIFSLKHTLSQFIVEDFSAEVLDGDISFSRLSIEKTPQESFAISPLVVKLKAVDIEQLLTSLNSESLKITGKFDLDLPLAITPDSQTIENGVFNNVTPGTLKVDNPDGEAANIAYQALDNFHYTEFSGTIDYSAEGDYIIFLHLLGANPDLYSGFPIKLDLTLRGTLPDLLYSMLITGDMTKPILDDIQQRAEPPSEPNIQP